MKPNQLAALVLRLIGIYSLVEAVPLLAINIGSAVLAGEPVSSGPSRTALAAWLVLPPIFRIIIGIILLMRADVLAQKLAPQGSGDEAIPSVSFEDIQVFMFAVAGVLIFSAALPQLFKSIFDLAQSLTDHSVYWAGRWRLATGAMGILIKAALGLVLFFRARGFANLWRSLRTFGTPKPPQS